MTIPEYDKEAWWAECKKEKPDMTREDFEVRWFHLWNLAQMLGIVTRKPT